MNLICSLLLGIALSAGAAQNVYVLALNNSGSPSGYWSGKVQGFAVTTATLTAGDYTALRSAFQALNSALSR